ncbi:effector-associated constant component EACC1 [Actinosynnema sp. ALI-1.44]|uniref:effector-associated constant component EACC1 n=1 Tax=Actinosynnema sp. ALI-1.44 TaxID=1933779 RepID=UPI001EDA848B|nr:hypothetical protein [Actinosynnema sp. ALI-1.44]
MNVEPDETADELRSLRQWLSDVDELRGRVTAVESPPAPGALGPVPDALVVALGPGATTTALATGLVAWLRDRHGEIRVKLTLSDRRTVELAAKSVAGLDAEAVEKQVAELSRLIASDGKDWMDRPDGP